MATTLDQKQVSCTNENRCFSPSEVYTYSQTRQLESLLAHVSLLNSTEEISVPSVRSCLHEMAKDHYMLHAKTVVQSNGDVCFAKMTDVEGNDDWIPLELHFTETRFDWKDIVKESFQKGFDFENGPMWRALWVTCPSEGDSSFSYIFIMIIFHALCDGKCVIDLCTNQFLSRLNFAVQGEEVFQLEKRPVHFTEPVEVVFGNAKSGAGLCEYPKPWYVKLIVKTLFFLNRKEINTDIPHIRCLEKPTKEVAKGSYFPFEVDEPTSKNLFTFCKRNSVSVNSVLLTLLGNSLNAMETEHEPFVGSFKTISSAIDLRKFKEELNISPMPLGCYVGGGQCKVKAVDIHNSKTVVEQATEVGAVIAKTNNGSPSNLGYSVLAYTVEQNRITDFNKIFFEATLSNLGRCNQPASSNDSDPVKVLGQYFTVSMRSPGVYLGTLSFKGRMFFCLAYDDKWFTEEFAKDLTDHLQNSIKIVGLLEN